MVRILLVPRKILEHIMKECVFKHLENKEVKKNGYSGLVKSKSCLTKLILFYDKVIGFVYQGRKEEMIYSALARF